MGSKFNSIGNEEFINRVIRQTRNEYLFLDQYKNLRTELRVKHEVCKHVYKVRPKDFLAGKKRCPKCIPSGSKGEIKIHDFLNRNKIKFISEFNVFISDLNSNFRFDVCASGVLIEFDGEQHYKAIDFFGGEAELNNIRISDRIKNDYCAANGIPLIRIPYWDYDRIDEILTEKLLPLLAERDAM